MTNEIHDAFAHPEARAVSTGDPAMPDRISLRDHIVSAEIGAFQAERGTTQRLCFNIVVEITPAGAPVEDDVDRILSYDKVTDAIALELRAERLNLLETLAERIATRVLLEPRALRIFVRIEKLDRGPGALGVEIVRTRRSRTEALSTPAEAGEDTPHPAILLLSNTAIASPDLGALIDTYAQANAPLVLCVGPGDTARPHATDPMAQRRIDLLAIEQNAWILAARDRRCVVVGTRTELDWAMRQGQLCVWAPSKMVLDASEGPTAPVSDAGALALWFAQAVEARRLITLGVDAPVSADLPVQVETLPG